MPFATVSNPLLDSEVFHDFWREADAHPDLGRRFLGAAKPGTTGMGKMPPNITPFKSLPWSVNSSTTVFAVSLRVLTTAGGSDLVSLDRWE
jgi:hypothetical protein